MKKFLLALLLIFVGAAPVFAARIDNIKTRGTSNIEERLDSLAALTAKIEKAKRLTDAQKKSLTDEIKTETTSLTTHKEHLNATTTVAEATTSFQQVFSAHYIYAFYLPRMERIIAADALSDAATNLTDLATKLETYVTAAQAKGEDTTAVEKKVTAEVKTKAASAQAKTQALITTLLALKVSDYPGNRTALITAGTTLRTIRTEDIQQANTAARSAAATLKTMLQD